jgi:hypothetical protein
VHRQNKQHDLRDENLGDLGYLHLAARGESTIGRVPSAAGADARRRDAGDAGTSSRSANAADAPAPPEPFGRIGIAGNLCVARRQRCPRIASSSRLDLARNTYARDLLYFHHGLLAARQPRRHAKIGRVCPDGDGLALLLVQADRVYLPGAGIVGTKHYASAVGRKNCIHNTTQTCSRREQYLLSPVQVDEARHTS